MKKYLVSACRFCGRKAQICKSYGHYVVYCPRCENEQHNGKTPDEAVKLWNKYHTPKMFETEVE